MNVVSPKYTRPDISPNWQRERNGKGHSCIVEFLGTWYTVPERAHFLLTLFIQSLGCRNFRPGTSHASYACDLLQRKTCLRHSLSNFQFISRSRFFFSPFKHSSTSRVRISVFSSFPFTKKLNFSRIEIQLNVAKGEIEVL